MKIGAKYGHILKISAVFTAQRTLFRESLRKHVVAGTLFYENVLDAWDTNYFVASSAPRPLLHLWSLGVEMQFYLLWPFLVIAGLKLEKPILAAACLTVASFALCVWLSYRSAPFAFFIPLSRLWEMSAGGLTALYVAPFDVLHRGWSSTLGLGMILLSALFFNQGMVYPGFFASIPVLGAMLIVGSSGQGLIGHGLLKVRWLLWMGLISYPLYLWHWPLLVFAAEINGHLGLNRYLASGAVALSIIAAAATYYGVEKPIRFGHLRPYAKVTCSLAAFALLTTGVLIHGGVLKGRHDGVLTEDALAHERARYWSATNLDTFRNAARKIVVFGDSQAVDIFMALRNNPRNGVAYFDSDHRCTALYEANSDSADISVKNACQKHFQRMAESDNLKQATVFVYAMLFRGGDNSFENVAAAQRGFAAIRRANPGINIVVFGPKALLGDSWVSINAIMRNKPAGTDTNSYLSRIASVDEQGVKYASEIAKAGNAAFVDTSRVFCLGGCAYFAGGKYLYFDQNHWTEEGAARFYRNLTHMDGKISWLL